MTHASSSRALSWSSCMHVNDVGIAYANQSDLDTILDNLPKKGLEFTREGAFADFLVEIKFVKNPIQHTVTLTQKGLIQKIIEVTGMTDCNSNWTPAMQQTLGMDPADGEPMQENWSYPLIVGMLFYRQRYSTIICPTDNLSINCYVLDADFSGFYGRDPDYCPSSAKSRTGYIITLGGLWKSQLQTEISLSTLEAEYSALSASMRTLLPLRFMLVEVIQALRLPLQFQATIQCHFFENNNGALLLATRQRIRNRTKYFLVKWHFFLSHVQNGEIKIVKIHTKEQWADDLTNGLSRETFEYIFKLVQQGW